MNHNQFQEYLSQKRIKLVGEQGLKSLIFLDKEL